MTIQINIERAIEEGRKIVFSHSKNDKLYYTTAFGELFFFPPSNKKIYKKELASDFVQEMTDYNFGEEED